MEKTVRIKGFDHLGSLPDGHEFEVIAKRPNDKTITADVICDCGFKREHSFRAAITKPYDLEEALKKDLKEHAAELGGFAHA